MIQFIRTLETSIFLKIWFSPVFLIKYNLKKLLNYTRSFLYFLDQWSKISFIFKTFLVDIGKSNAQSALDVKIR